MNKSQGEKAGLKHASQVPASEPKPAYSEDGVDLTMIRWMLSLTPAERLEVLQQTVRSIMKLRGETGD